MGKIRISVDLIFGEIMELNEIVRKFNRPSLLKIERAYKHRADMVGGPSTVTVSMDQDGLRSLRPELYRRLERVLQIVPPELPEKEIAAVLRRIKVARCSRKKKSGK